MIEKLRRQADPAAMNTLLLGEILNRERIDFCVKCGAHKTKSGHRISGLKSPTAGKVASQVRFDPCFSSGQGDSFCLMSAAVWIAIEASDCLNEQASRSLVLPRG